MSRKGDMEDLVTQMARAGMSLQDQFGDQIKEVTGADVLDADDLTELYLKSNFDQRLTLFQEVLAAEGADGLRTLGTVYENSLKRLNQEGNGS